MNHTEWYELRCRIGNGQWENAGVYDRESEAVRVMEIQITSNTAWRVVRVSEVIVASEARG